MYWASAQVVLGCLGSLVVFLDKTQSIISKLSFNLHYRMHNYERKTDGQLAKCWYTVVGDWHLSSIISIHQGKKEYSNCPAAGTD